MNHQGEWKLAWKIKRLENVRVNSSSEAQGQSVGVREYKTNKRGKNTEKESCTKVFPIVCNFPLPYWLALGLWGLGKYILSRLFSHGNNKNDNLKIRIPLYARVVMPFKPKCIIGLGFEFFRMKQLRELFLRGTGC